MTSYRHNGGPPIVESPFGPNGWIAIGRDIRFHPLVGFGLPVAPSDPERGSYSRGEAWQDLMMECRYKDGVVNNSGRPMNLRRGQLLGANSWLAHRWNWTPKTVRWWLEKLSDEGMIAFGNAETMHSPDDVQGASKQGRSKGRLANTITICNFDVFQMLPIEQRQVEGQVNGRLTAGLGQVNGDIYKEETKEQGNKETNNTRVSGAIAIEVAGAREGEEDAGFGVYVNGKSIRHAAFAISIDGVRMQTLASGLTPEQTIEICKGHALQWAMEIENGKRAADVVPSKIANFLSSSIIATANRGAQQSVRVARANRGYAGDPDKPTETTTERWKRFASESAAKKKDSRNV